MHDINRTLQLWCEQGQVHELRVPKTKRRGVISGYFDDLKTLAVNADTLSDDIDVPAVYLTLNPVLPDLIARSANETTDRYGVTTKDGEIARRRLLLVDCDPRRPAGISSSEVEHQAALDRSRQIRDYLTREGFPPSVLADSGNGGHNLYRIDLPNDQEAANLLKRFLESLAARFGDAAVAVDTSVWNASRICKLYGTMVRKGSNLLDRPWRKSLILECPEQLQVVPVELLRKLTTPTTTVLAPVPASTPKKSSPRTPGQNTAADVEKLMETSGLKSGPPTPYDGGLRWVLDECPWHEEHSDGPGGSAIFLRDGIMGFDCKHAHCQNRTIRDVLGPVNGHDWQREDFKKDPKKFDRMARAFVDHHAAQGRHLLYAGGRTYFYAGCRYAECDELPMMVRGFFKDNGWSQSNNVVGNVVPIIQSYVWKDATTFGQMPFWTGGDRPFADARNIIAYTNGLLDTSDPARGLIPHSSNWCSTVCLPFAYDPLATCPAWEKFLAEVFEGDHDRVALLQEFFGYCLASDTSLQKALVLVGKPRSGKGTIQRLLGALAGPDNSTGFSLERLATEFGPSALVNKGVALVGEVELAANPQRTKIVEVLKSIIGEDALSINTKYEAKFTSRRLPTRFVIASNSVPRLLDASGALAHRFLFVPFEISFVGREDIHLEEKLLAELPGIANWALAGLRRLRAAGGRFTLGEGHKRLAAQYAADTSPIMAWVRSEMVVHRRADPGDLPPECLTAESVSIAKSDAYDRYTAWCEAHDIEPTRPAWFGRDLKTLIPKLQEGRDTREDGSRPMVYRGLGIRQATGPEDRSSDMGCKADKNPAPSRNGVAVPLLSGQSGHLDRFVQLLQETEEGTGREKVVENKENALTALTQPPSTDSEGEPSMKTNCAIDNQSSLREARLLSRNMRLEYRNGYVVQPDINDLSLWRVGKDVDGTVRWLDQTGIREWAVSEVQRRLAPKPTRPQVATPLLLPVPENENDDAGTAADVLNTLICNLDEGKFDLDDPDDLDDLECQIAPALDIPETANMAATLLTDLDEYCLSLDAVRLRVDEMLAVLLRLEEEQMGEKEAKSGCTADKKSPSPNSEGGPGKQPGCKPDSSLRLGDEMTLEEALKWLDENLVGCG